MVDATSFSVFRPRIGRTISVKLNLRDETVHRAMLEHFK